MSLLYYRLQIDCEPTQQETVSTILDLTPTIKSPWIFEIEVDQIPIDGITYLVGLLSDKFERLNQLGITRENISIWILYAYENQCNLEFTPTQLGLLSNERIHLCISCWEAN